MRFIVYGAGAVGGVIAGRLSQHGHDVVAIARGAHHDAIRQRGLEIRDPDETVTVQLPVVDHPSQLTFGAGDVVVLAMKSQHTLDAVESLAAVAGPDVPVVCAQNGVENERVALRRFARVHGLCVMLPATHLEPGVVETNSAPVAGILDVGRYPTGADDDDERMAAALDTSGFSSRPHPEIMRAKYAKLLMNLGNALEAACGDAARGGDLWMRARDEARACFAAAGIDCASEDEDAARRGDLVKMRRVGGRRREGGSSWQSLARGTGNVEADYLNGEIVLLGRLHDVPTPVNALLQRVAVGMSRNGSAPGSVSIEELLAQIG